MSKNLIGDFCRFMAGIGVVLGVATLPLSASAGQEAGNGAGTRGTLKNGVYSNDVVGITVRLPKGWLPLDIATAGLLMKEQNPVRLRDRFLVGATPIPVAQAKGDTAVMVCVADPRASVRAGMDAEQLAFAIMDQQLQLRPRSQNRGVTTRDISGQRFSVVSVDFDPDATPRRISETYITMRSAHVLQCILTYSTRPDRERMVESIVGMKVK